MINASVSVSEAPDTPIDIKFQIQLIDLSLGGLEKMYDPEKGRFCFRMKLSERGLEREGHHFIYTLISLLGLHRAVRRGYPLALDLSQARQARLDNLSDIDSAGTLGLTLWLFAQADPHRLEALFKTLQPKKALLRYEDARAGMTMEMSWLLTGLCESLQANPDLNSRYRNLARQVYQAIVDNYGGRGIFAHMSNRTFVGKVRGRIGSFADQVYPIYALTKFARTLDHPEALQIAGEVAETLVRHQGPLGQWWWHYDALTGKVIGKYPVYAVHQDGMAPMALLALGEATGRDFGAAIRRGLAWLQNNEAGADFIDSEHQVIWRNLQVEKYKLYAEKGLSLMNINYPRSEWKNLTVLRECWSYHLGWVLYALAGENRLNTPLTAGETPLQIAER